MDIICDTKFSTKEAYRIKSGSNFDLVKKSLWLKPRETKSIAIIKLALKKIICIYTIYVNYIFLYRPLGNNFVSYLILKGSKIPLTAGSRGISRLNFFLQTQRAAFLLFM